MTGSGRTLLAIAAVVGLLLFAGPAPASARVSGNPGTQLLPEGVDGWITASCADGAVTDCQLERDETAQLVLRLSGWIQPCGQDEITNGYAIVYFANGRFWRSEFLPYTSMDSPTTVDFAVPYPSGNASPGELPVVCLASSYGGREDCLSVEPAGPGEPPVVVRVSRDDPRIPDLGPFKGAKGPTCGTCA